MEKLTIQHVLKNKFSYIDMVKYFKPEWDNEMCDLFLWENTAFPFNGDEGLIIQLNRIFITDK